MWQPDTLPLSHLLEADQDHSDFPVEEMCLTAAKQSLTLQLVPDLQHARHQVVCMGDLSQEDHPDQGVIVLLQQSSACRRTADG